jgi:hypothetical protein
MSKQSEALAGVQLEATRALVLAERYARGRPRWYFRFAEDERGLILDLTVALRRIHDYAENADERAGTGVGRMPIVGANEKGRRR